MAKSGMMRVLLLTDEMLLGGVPRHVKDLANGLFDRGIHVEVASVDGPSRRLLNPQIPFTPLRLLFANSFRKNPAGLFSSLKALSSVVSSQGITIIHSHKRYSDLVGRIVARWANITHISTCHNTFHTLRHLTPYGDFTIACCAAVEDILVGDFGKSSHRVRTIYYGVKPLFLYSGEKKERAKRELNLTDHRIVVGSVMHLSRNKDPITLIKTLAILKERLQQMGVCFVLQGEGELSDEVSRQSEQLGLRQVIKFLPASSNVEALMNIADFFVLPSVREGLPYVLLEAASLEKPFIATTVGGIPEFIHHSETGILVPPRSPSSMADAIMYLLERPSEVVRLGKNAKKRFEHQHSYDRFITQTTKVYESALDGTVE